jgi:hypothetical protein
MHVGLSGVTLVSPRCMRFSPQSAARQLSGTTALEKMNVSKTFRVTVQ